MTPQIPIKVAVVEDNEKIRDSLATLLSGSAGFRCVGQFASAEEALKNLRLSAPDVVLMDINLPDMTGIECVKKLKGQLPDLKIIMHTVYEDEELLFKALRAGAHGYLVKRTPPAKLLESIAEVHDGSSPMSGHIARMVVQYFHQNSDREETTESLTQREREILEHLAKGYQNKEIAGLLGIGFDTVRSHLKNIYEKLHVNSRTEAVIKFLGK
jgi:DNA-binding NarL/FixJ family response regulator